MLDATKLATLGAVIEHGSFSAAGKALGLTQPAVSRQVALLEQRLGTELVRRSRQGIQPTEAGRILAEHAQAVSDRLARADRGVFSEPLCGPPPPPAGIELWPLFADPLRVLLPARHRLAPRDTVAF